MLTSIRMFWTRKKNDRKIHRSQLEMKEKCKNTNGNWFLLQRNDFIMLHWSMQQFIKYLFRLNYFFFEEWNDWSNAQKMRIGNQIMSNSEYKQFKRKYDFILNYTTFALATYFRDYYNLLLSILNYILILIGVTFDKHKKKI